MRLRIAVSSLALLSCVFLLSLPSAGATAPAQAGVTTFAHANVSESAQPGVPVVGIASVSQGGGYWVAYSNGYVQGVGQGINYGNAVSYHLAAPIVGIASTPDGGGYWLVAADGGVFSFGDAVFYGSMGGTKLNARVVGMTSTTDGHGYWLVAADGGVFSFGEAGFYGTDYGATATPVAISSDGLEPGYLAVNADASILTIGPVPSWQPATTKLNAPIVGITLDPGTKAGYWLVAADGGVFSYEGAQFYGALAGTNIPSPVVGMAALPEGKGYLIAEQDGNVVVLGDAYAAY
jgi:uncharacterized membrane protein YecN with MAPEG domain